MEAPEKISGESVALLDGLVSEYPYFQTAQVLLAKALSNEKSIRYEEQLRIAAAYAADRKALHSLIMHSVAETEDTTPVEKPEVETQNIASPEIQQDTITPVKEQNVQTQNIASPEIQQDTTTPLEEPIVQTQDIASPDIPQDTTTPVEEQNVQTQNIASPETQQDTTTPVEEPKVQTQNITSPETQETPVPPALSDLPPLEQNIIVKAIDASIELEVSEQMPFKEETEKEETEKEETEKEEKGKEKTEKQEAEPETQNPGPVKEEQDFNPDAPHTFSEWLKYAKQAKAQEEKAEKEEPQKPQDEPVTEQKEEKKKPKTRRTIDDLIDKFITEEPKISRPGVKQDFFSPVNMAKQSVEDANEFVSETLANIYLKQGSYAKAIKAYETLSLKFPEKKLYFAARIKEIKKIIKDQK
jgi:hypothetical protein